MKCNNWKLEGSCGEFIHGTTHEPSGNPKGTVLVGHGFKGYKDYGMFPWLAQKFAEIGFTSHRFNFSHSGMLDNDGPFERPDLFKLATWNTQVDDLKILCDKFAVDGLPTITLGHSRGGVACLLASGRGAVKVDGIISLSAPSTCNPLANDTQKLLLSQGYVESPSSRTNQMLYIGSCFLQEQIDDPQTHDLLHLIESFSNPVLVVHGEDDPTVSVDSALSIADAVKHPTLVRVPNADHVFNTPNPFPVDGMPSNQLAEVWRAIGSWLQKQLV